MSVIPSRDGLGIGRLGVAVGVGEGAMAAAAIGVLPALPVVVCALPPSEGVSWTRKFDEGTEVGLSPTVGLAGAGRGAVAGTAVANPGSRAGVGFDGGVPKQPNASATKTATKSRYLIIDFFPPLAPCEIESGPSD